MSAGPYSVTITMSETTVSALANSGYALYGFKGVHSSDSAALPLVWSRCQSYGPSTVVSWTDELQAYTSQTSIKIGQSVEIGFGVPIEIGQLMTVDQPGGSGTVTTDGTAHVVSILNSTNDPFTCGVRSKTDAFAAVCAMPLYGNGLQLIAPVPTILLLFSTVTAVPGSPVAVSPGPGVLVDQATAPQATLTFDINAGWGPTDEPYITPVPARSNLPPLLARYSASLAQAMRATVAEVAQR